MVDLFCVSTWTKIFLPLCWVLIFFICALITLPSDFKGETRRWKKEHWVFINVLFINRNWNIKPVSISKMFFRLRNDSEIPWLEFSVDILYYNQRLTRCRPLSGSIGNVEVCPASMCIITQSRDCCWTSVHRSLSWVS